MATETFMPLAVAISAVDAALHAARKRYTEAHAGLAIPDGGVRTHRLDPVKRTDYLSELVVHGAQVEVFAGALDRLRWFHGEVGPEATTAVRDAYKSAVAAVLLRPPTWSNPVASAREAALANAHRDLATILTPRREG